MTLNVRASEGARGRGGEGVTFCYDYYLWRIDDGC
jgi:hypothetical protein